MSEPIEYPENQNQPVEFNEVAVGLPPADVFDPVIEVFKKKVDRAVLRENLTLSPQQRSEKFVAAMKSVWQRRLVPGKKTSSASTVELPCDESIDVVDDPVPADAYHPLIAAIKDGVDRSLLRKNLELTQAERAEKFVKFASFAEELRQAGRRAREQDPSWGLK